MNSSYHSSVTDEMLSAYIDGVATTQERALIEAALAESNDVVWRLESMQHTVDLLKQLPELQPSHSFTLTESMVGAAPASTPVRAQVPEESAGFWQTLQAFFEGGNPLMRNFAAASFAAFLVLAGLGTFMTEPVVQSSSVTVLPANSAMVADAPQAEAIQPSTEVALLATDAAPATTEDAPVAAAPMMAAEAGLADGQTAADADTEATDVGQVGAAAAPMAAPMAAPVPESAAQAEQMAPPVVAEEAIADEATSASAAALSQADAPAADAPAAEAAPDDSAGAANEENINQPTMGTTTEEPSALWYLAYISLALAGVFAVLWLISRRNYAPAI
jgi:hypothetical protein